MEWGAHNAPGAALKGALSGQDDRPLTFIPLDKLQSAGVSSGVVLPGPETLSPGQGAWSGTLGLCVGGATAAGGTLPSTGCLQQLESPLPQECATQQRQQLPASASQLPTPPTTGPDLEAALPSPCARGASNQQQIPLTPAATVQPLLSSPGGSGALPSLQLLQLAPQEQQRDVAPGPVPLQQLMSQASPQLQAAVQAHMVQAQISAALQLSQQHRTPQTQQTQQPQQAAQVLGAPALLLTQLLGLGSALVQAEAQALQAMLAQGLVPEASAPQAGVLQAQHEVLAAQALAAQALMLQQQQQQSAEQKKKARGLPRQLGQLGAAGNGAGAALGVQHNRRGLAVRAAHVGAQQAPTTPQGQAQGPVTPSPHQGEAQATVQSGGAGTAGAGGSQATSSLPPSPPRGRSKGGKKGRSASTRAKGRKAASAPPKPAALRRQMRAAQPRPSTEPSQARKLALEKYPLRKAGRPPKAWTALASKQYNPSLNGGRDCSTIKSSDRTQFMFLRACNKCYACITAEAANKSSAFYYCKYHCAPDEPLCSEDEQERERKRRRVASSHEKEAEQLVRALLNLEWLVTEHRALCGRAKYGGMDISVPVQVGSQRRWLYVEVDGQQHGMHNQLQSQEEGQQQGQQHSQQLGWGNVSAAEQQLRDRKRDNASLDQGMMMVRLHHNDKLCWQGRLQSAADLASNQSRWRFVLYTPSHGLDDRAEIIRM